MDEKFIIVWTVDGETTSITHSTQDAALHQAEKLLREHGCDLKITLHLDDKISPPSSIWLNRPGFSGDPVERMGLSRASGEPAQAY